MRSTLQFSSRLLTMVCLLLGLGAVPVFAQITFSDFSNVSSLALNGSATNVNNGNQFVLRLTANGTTHQSGTAWFQTQQQSISAGFTSVFQFQITHTGTQADGFAFVIQNSTGEGFGTAALGGSGGAIGYGVPDPGDIGTAIPNSLAVEFDTFTNGWDPNSNHIAVQSCGPDANTQIHNAICPNESNSTLGILSNLGTINLSDGVVHTAVVEYDPGTLRIFIDDFGTPLLVVNTDLSTLLTLNSGSAWVGFTGAVGALSENNDILSWTFTPATAQTSITQTLISDPVNPQTTNYVYGSYNHKVQYTGANSGDLVTVTAIPIDQATFKSTRLVGSPFPNADCVIYDGTGGLCVVFEVTCQQTMGSDCTGLNYDLFNNFNTSQTILGAGVLKAPISTNNWQNIIETFTQTRNDPGSHSGSKGFSDFVMVQNATAAPTITISAPANGSSFKVGDTVQVEFTCKPDPTAPLVTVPTCGGILNGKPVNSGDLYTFALTDLGMGSIVISAADSVMNTSGQTATFNVGIPPMITSAGATAFQTGILGSFLVTATGTPPPTIMESGSLPSGVNFVDNGNGSATLGGTPAAGTGGLYNLVQTATNLAGSDVKGFALTVNQPPAITSANNATFQLSMVSSFVVTTTGFPTSAITESGALPAGVSFTDNGNGTATLAGTPLATGTFNLMLTASNGVNPVATQSFTLTVTGPMVSVSPTSINFGTVKQLSLLWKNVTIKNTGTATVTFSKIYVTPGSGADSDDYTPLSFCGSSLAPGKSCTVTVFFFADDLGTLNATLNIADNASGSPQQVSLTGIVIKRGH
jgi:hypothetical protein